jgi:hypothetical protein
LPVREKLGYWLINLGSAEDLAYNFLIATVLLLGHHSHIAIYSKLAIMVHVRIFIGWLIIMAAPDDIKNILGSNEKIELYIEEKIYHPRINIESVIITNERIILRHPHALGLKKDYTDYSYRDILNVTLDKGIMRSTIKLTLKPKEGNQGKNQEEHLELDKLPNDLAEKGYGVIRENIGKFQSPFSTGYANLPK